MYLICRCKIFFVNNIKLSLGIKMVQLKISRFFWHLYCPPVFSTYCWGLVFSGQLRLRSDWTQIFYPLEKNGWLRRTSRIEISSVASHGMQLVWHQRGNTICYGAIHSTYIQISRPNCTQWLTKDCILARKCKIEARKNFPWNPTPLTKAEIEARNSYKTVKEAKENLSNDSRTF